MKYRGEWRFLGEGHSSYYGDIEFNHGTEIILEILDDEQHSLFSHRPDIQCELIILGKLENGQKVTLRNCTILSSVPFLDHLRIIRIESQFALIGAHYEQIKLELDAIIVSFSNLNSFISYADLFGETHSELNRNTNRYERELEIPEI